MKLLETRTTLPDDVPEPPRVAVIGAGIAGAACAAGLLRAGIDVTVFDKSGGVGGRMATRRVAWVDARGSVRSTAIDHGCAGFRVAGPRFRAEVERVAARGGASRWRERVHARFPAAGERDVVVPTPDAPAFCRHLLDGVPLRLGRAVTGLRRDGGGWSLDLGPGDGDAAPDPFDRVVVALPPAQAAALLRGHRDDWAAALAAVRMQPCWTLMALTDDLDWPWDSAEVEHGELASIARQDRLPGRSPSGVVAWVAHATPEWSAAHLEDDPAAVREVLSAALGRWLTGGPAPHWHHTAVHRWRYARRGDAAGAGASPWHCASTGLGVCGDAVADDEGGVEAAWASGDALARDWVESFRRDRVAPRAARVLPPPLTAGRPAVVR